MQRSSHCIWTSRNFSRAAELTLMTAVGAMLMVFATACPPPAPPLPPSPQSLPADARDACPLSPATFASWFQTGTVTKDGVVNPADSLQVLSPNCGFYQWSEQMYMWLTSPAPATYGGAVDASLIRRLFLTFHLPSRTAAAPSCRILQA